jgi:nucleotide-binding universal stress UspA family protein
MIKRILVPLDGSDLAGQVLPQVEDLARRLPAEVWFLRVVELYPAMLTVEPTGAEMASAELVLEALDAEEEEAGSQLASLVSEWQDRGISATWQVIRGDAAQSIVEFARSNDIDLIAMSTHGRSGLSRLIVGSVAELVVLDSGLPVMVIRPVEKVAEPAAAYASGASVPARD